MLNQQIINLMTYFQELPLMNQNNHLSSIQEYKLSIYQSVSAYNDLLMQCLSLVKLCQQNFSDFRHVYNSLALELDSQRVIRQRDGQEMQVHIEVLEAKINQLKCVVNQKQNQVESLRSAIQQKQQKIWQIQNHNEQTIQKLQQQLTTTQKQAQQHQKEQIQKITKQLQTYFTQRVQKLEEQQKYYLTQNQLLSTRLEELMRYIETVDHQESYFGQLECGDLEISPRIICGLKERGEEREDMDSQGRDGERGSLGLSSDIGRDEDFRSQETSSPQRLVLHEILNTEDRKSINYGEKYLSKQRLYLNSIPNENLNSLNNLTSRQASTVQKLKIIQQFTTIQTIPFQATKQSPTLYQPVDLIQLLPPKQQPQQSQTSVQPVPVQPVPVQPVASSLPASQACSNPYQIFFTLLVQCAKIECGDLEAASRVDVSEMWGLFFRKKVPLHKWYQKIAKRLNQHIKNS